MKYQAAPDSTGAAAFCAAPQTENQNFPKKAVDLRVLEAYAILVSVSGRMGASGNVPAGK